MLKCLAVVVCVASFCAGDVWAQRPYYVTDLGGLSWNYVGTQPNNEAGTLLSNGTVMGTSHLENSAVEPPPIPGGYLATWTPSKPNGITGAATYVDPTNGGGPLPGAGGNVNMWRTYGDASGRFGVDDGGSVKVWDGTTYSTVPGMYQLYGMGPSGLLVGNNGTGAFAYDINTNTPYAIVASGAANGFGANANGYVVGYTGSCGFVWSSATGLTTLSNFYWTVGISANNRLVAGESSDHKAAVYDAVTGLTTTYWTGEASYVNNSGVVVGDTDPSGMEGGRAWVSVGGTQYDLKWAPTGVTFNYAAGLNDAGQILVSAGSNAAGVPPWKSYLLTPAMAGDANLDGTVDINDLSKVLTNYDKSRHGLGRRRLQRRRQGGHQRPEQGADQLRQERRSVRRRQHRSPCPSPAPWRCWLPAWPACWPTPGESGSSHRTPLSLWERGRG